jgi:hypothetical protein
MSERDFSGLNMLQLASIFFDLGSSSSDFKNDLCLEIINRLQRDEQGNLLPTGICVENGEPTPDQEDWQKRQYIL